MKQNLPFLAAAFLSLAASIDLHAAQDYVPYLVTTSAGDPGVGINDGPRASARFNRPSGAAKDGAGNIYIADLSNHTIRKITPTGDVVTVAGQPGRYGSTNGPASVARFNQPQSLVVDSAGNIFVAELGNHDVRKIAPGGTVSTLAGLAGVPGSSDGMGSAARFYEPDGIALDAAGNLFVADSQNHTIRRITPAGDVTTVAGAPGVSGSTDGSGVVARFYNPRGIAISPGGDLYIADEYNSTIRKMTPTGLVTTFAGTAGAFGSVDGTGASARFDEPVGVASDASGVLWVTDTRQNNVRRITPAAVVTTVAGRAGVIGGTDGSGSSATFNAPAGLTVASDGNLYLADSLNQSIRRITPSYVVSTYAGTTSAGTNDGTGGAARFCFPNGLATDSGGNVYVGDVLNHSIRRMTPAGAVTTVAGSSSNAGYVDGTASNARFSRPIGVAVDSAGNIFVGDSGNNCIRKISSTGNVTTFAGSLSPGSADGTGTAARFSYPTALTVDGAGNVYVADTRNHTIRKITPAAVVTTLAGLAGAPGYVDGNGSSARFSSPVGITVDAAGQLYVTEFNNFTIRKITPAGTVTTLAGQAATRGYDDGIGSGALFISPRGITVAPDGNIYVSDAGIIRRVTAAGRTYTLAGKPYDYKTADGVADRAGFASAEGIAATTGGKIYVADSISNAIRSGRPTVQASAMLSRKHDTSSTSDWDVALPLIGSPGVECRSGGAAGNFEIVFAFDTPVSFTSAMVASGTGHIASVDATNPSKIHVFLDSVTNAQRIIVRLRNVSNGILTNDVDAEMGVLLGDVSGDGFVNSADVIRVRNLSGQQVDSSNFRNDCNLDGYINSGDALVARAHSGEALP